MTEAVDTTGATTSHDTEATAVARPAAPVRPLRLVYSDAGDQEISFAGPLMVPADTASLVLIGAREPTDEELLQGLRELMAEDERELGPIPDDAKAEVERQWRD